MPKIMKATPEIFKRILDKSLDLKLEMLEIVEAICILGDIAHPIFNNHSSMRKLGATFARN